MTTPLQNLLQGIKSWVNTQLSGKTDNSAFTGHTGSTDVHLAEGDRALIDSISGKAAQVDLTAHTGNTGIHVTADEKSAIGKIGDLNDLTLTADTIVAAINLVEAKSSLKVEVVQELPTPGEEGKIYLKAASTSGTSDLYDEFIWVKTGTSVTEGIYEKIGSATIDLSNYYTKDEVYTKDEIHNTVELPLSTAVNDLYTKVLTTSQSTLISELENITTQEVIDEMNRQA